MQKYICQILSKQARREISRREIRGGEGLESGENLKGGEDFEREEDLKEGENFESEEDLDSGEELIMSILPQVSGKQKNERRNKI